jgi:hypothetical protein
MVSRRNAARSDTPTFSRPLGSVIIIGCPKFLIISDRDIQNIFPEKKTRCAVQDQAQVRTQRARCACRSAARMPAAAQGDAKPTGHLARQWTRPTHEEVLDFS